ncbi:protein kinase domain-containing protein [Kallotenue papyrolyticum]|uniref:protein kinase domain-containing protein n=1 Tax=Kallotenue papyrolyticum TaxID=1325125 RepID=UPI00047857DB|nr:protein kinase [Kallotenue papyrolyticum]
MFDHLPVGTVVEGQQGRYEVLAVVGRGGMGVVYRVRDLATGAIWALKEQRPAEPLKPDELEESRRLFEQEARLVLSISHPNAVSGRELFEWQGRQYFVMEFVNGETLEKRLREANAPAFEQDALRWTIQMARVLHYLHSQQPPIIYRDLKPANVILTPEGTIKFIDFGVARTHKVGKAKDTVAIGTYGYAPPEQYGKGQTDARSDVYTLGATLYHLLTNLPPRPLHTPKPGEIQALNPSVQPATEQIVIRAMQQEREARYPSALAMEQAMQARLREPVPSTLVTPAAAPVAVPEDATVRTAAPVVPPRARASRAPAVGPTARQVPLVVPVTPVVEPGARFCPNCGRGNKAAARFCAACGAALPVVSAAPAVAPAPQPAPLPAARFRVVTPRGTWEFPLLTLPIRIGRRDPSQNHYPELDLADYDRGHASRRHAVVERRGDQYVLTDIGSVNGTLINGRPLPPHRPHPLRGGDRIKIGDVELLFEWV